MNDTKWRARTMYFYETAHGLQYRADQETEHEKFYEYGKYYTEVQRDGQAVLHVLADYYIDAIMDAAQAEDIPAALSDTELGGQIAVLRGNLHVGLVNMIIRDGRIHKGAVTAQIIANTMKRLTTPDDDQPSLTRSTMPVIEPEIANKGVDRAKSNGAL